MFDSFLNAPPELITIFAKSKIFDRTLNMPLPAFEFGNEHSQKLTPIL